MGCDFSQRSGLATSVPTLSDRVADEYQRSGSFGCDRHVFGMHLVPCGQGHPRVVDHSWIGCNRVGDLCGISEGKTGKRSEQEQGVNKRAVRFHGM
jgi:hypothetical protein